MAERVDFYVLEGSDPRERLRFACRLIGKAFEADLRVLAWCTDEAAVRELDELLWTFAQDTFIPHEPAAAGSSWDETPVLIASSAPPPDGAQVLLNLAAALPPGIAAAQRVIEVVDAEPGRRQAGRERFRQYREAGLEPQTHAIGA